ncbi:thiamine pyrophosphate-requiring protein [Ramlibacter sp. AW1]|uniref:Thiamine pyrophosphate-requiring protein n=1 Tax=Ramlibacter aurantiacus TaxID=2801330 RepID=A0A936ZJ97_9BURK|nr:thiamine pyrophosphate-requiring protein [Ramlibacter aurantiacus]MBL0420857.1 thiamine pyrophosphate-requiring protein [Ramlibacter aurantiacus]
MDARTTRLPSPEVPPEPAIESVAEAFLALLKDRGIENFYVGAGTDTAPIVEAYARAGGRTDRYPNPIVCTHENLALGMAHGYYMVSGRPQAVMLHVSVGTGNAVCGVMNAARGQAPVLFTAGRTPLYEHGRLGARDSEIHWGQEMFDQAGLVREMVKWDYELRNAIQVEDLVDRALTIAMSEPRGPVYLTLPREVLAEPAPDLSPRAAPAIPAPPAPDPRAVMSLAQALTRAKEPVIMCTASGADMRTVDALSALCNRYGIAVGEARPRYVNVPSSHPLHVGYDRGAIFEWADALLFLESDVPWIPGKASPVPGTFIAQAGTDPAFARYPVRGHRCDLSITTTVHALIEALDVALRECGAEASAGARRQRLSARAAIIASTVGERIGADQAQGGPITKAFLSTALDAVRPRDAIVVNEYSALRECFTFEEPGCYFLHPDVSGLGWGYPAALGAKQAAPDRTVFAVMGDGAYLFANPAVCHHASAMHGLPVIAVVFDNGGWEAVHRSAVGIYPDSHSMRFAKSHEESSGMAPLCSLDPMPDFTRYAEASGGVGLRVTERSRLEEALRRAVAVAEGEKRQVLVHVIGRG